MRVGLGCRLAQQFQKSCAVGRKVRMGGLSSRSLVPYWRKRATETRKRGPTQWQTPSVWQQLNPPASSYLCPPLAILQRRSDDRRKRRLHNWRLHPACLEMETLRPLVAPRKKKTGLDNYCLCVVLLFGWKEGRKGKQKTFAVERDLRKRKQAPGQKSRDRWQKCSAPLADSPLRLR